MSARAQKKAVLATRIQALQAELTRVECEPEDEYPAGTIVKFEHLFSPGGRSYSYAAIKANHVGAECWYRTGSGAGVGPGRMTWEEVLVWAEPGSLKYILPNAPAWDVVD